MAKFSKNVDHWIGGTAPENDAPGLHGHHKDLDFEQGLEHGIGHGRRHIEDPVHSKDTARVATPRGATPRFDGTKTWQGPPILAGSKIGSNTGYISVAGTILAIPHGGRARSSQGPRFQGISETTNNFREIPSCYASMQKKPLVPYHPNAHRSRLAILDPPRPANNGSSIVFDGGFLACKKKRFLTTNMTHYTGEDVDRRANQGIIAEDTKYRRFLSDK